MTRSMREWVLLAALVSIGVSSCAPVSESGTSINNERAAWTVPVKLLGPVILAEICGTNLQDRLQATVIPKLFRALHPMVDLFDQ